MPRPLCALALAALLSACGGSSSSKAPPSATPSATPAAKTPAATGLCLTAPTCAAACASKQREGCARHAIIVFNGWATARDQERATQIATAACDGGDGWACDALSRGLEFDGEDREPDDTWKARAKLARARACTDGDQLACLMGHVTTASKPNWPAIEKLCNDGLLEACLLGAVLARFDQEAPIQIDAEKAYQRGLVACQAGAMDACTLLPLTQSGDNNPRKAEAKRVANLVHEKQCDAGWVPSCDHLYKAYQDDDPERAAAVRRKACNLGAGYACD